MARAEQVWLQVPDVALHVQGLPRAAHAEQHFAAAFAHLGVFDAPGLQENHVAHGLSLAEQEFVAREGAGAGAGDDFRTFLRREAGEQGRCAHLLQVLGQTWVSA